MRKHRASIFSLLKLLGKAKKMTTSKIIISTDCTLHGLHDYYCDREKPFV